ncbi:hypothetical protein AB0O07_32690 [Streptomyces sp. NPDC093085]|uniref:hypothetical protein n=1 Tax=Streptomyces sp. NPDC093085 TaxID=3155068 RepID=UPI003432E65D
MRTSHRSFLAKFSASSVRSALSVALILLLTLLVPLSAVAAWTGLEIGTTRRFVAATAPLSADPAVRKALADRITEQVMTEIHDSGGLDAGPFQADLERAVRTLLHDALLSFTDSAAFKNAWRTAVRATHSTMEEALSKGRGNAVTLDLAPVVRQVKAQLISDGVPFADRIPVRDTRIVVLEADGLGVWRQVVQGLRAAGIWPAVGTALLAAGAVALAAAGRRSRAVSGAGLAVAAGGALLVVAVAVARATVLQDLPDDGDRQAAAAFYDALTGSLRVCGWALLAAGLLLALAGWPAVWLTRRLRGRGGGARGGEAGGGTGGEPSVRTPGSPPASPDFTQSLCR